jgi:hypothetical protein
MPPLSYPDLSWSGRANRFLRTLQIIAIAGSIGAVGGGLGALALMGLPGSPSHRPIGAAAANARTTPPARSAIPTPPPAVAASPQRAPQPATAAQPAQTMTAASSPDGAAVPTPPDPSTTPPRSTLAATQSRPAPPTTVKTPPRDQARRRSDAPTVAAERSQPAIKALYDRAQPADNDVGTADRSLSAQPSASNHGKLTSKRAKKRTFASTSQYQPAPLPRYAPPAAVPVLPPMVIVPPQGRALSEDGGWRGRNGGDWRYPRESTSGYSDRRYDDDYGRASDRGSWGGGPFGLFGGGDWRD